jgi:hypothetical protein
MLRKSAIHVGPIIYNYSDEHQINLALDFVSGLKYLREAQYAAGFEELW